MQTIFLIPGDVLPGSFYEDSVLVCCNATDAAFTVYLPDAKETKNRQIRFHKTDSSANAVTVSTVNGQTISHILAGVATAAETVAISEQYAMLEVVSDGAVYRAGMFMVAGGSVYGLTAGYIPYAATATTLANGPFWTDATDVSIGIAAIDGTLPAKIRAYKSTDNSWMTIETGAAHKSAQIRFVSPSLIDGDTGGANDVYIGPYLHGPTEEIIHFWSYAKNALVIGTNNVDCIRLKADGSAIGLGLANAVDPSRRLHLYGTSDVYFRVETGTASKTAQIEFKTNTYGSNMAYVGIAGSGYCDFWNYANIPMRFATNNTLAMQISTDGKVCINGATSGVGALNITAASNVAIDFGNGLGTGRILHGTGFANSYGFNTDNADTAQTMMLHDRGLVRQATLLLADNYSGFSTKNCFGVSYYDTVIDTSYHPIFTCNYSGKTIFGANTEHATCLVRIASDSGLSIGADNDFTITQSGANTTLANVTSNGDFKFSVNDGGVTRVPLWLDADINSVKIDTKNGNLLWTNDTQHQIVISPYGVAHANTSVCDFLIPDSTQQVWTGWVCTGVRRYFAGIDQTNSNFYFGSTDSGIDPTTYYVWRIVRTDASRFMRIRTGAIVEGAEITGGGALIPATLNIFSYDSNSPGNYAQLVLGRCSTEDAVLGVAGTATNYFPDSGIADVCLRAGQAKYLLIGCGGVSNAVLRLSETSITSQGDIIIGVAGKGLRIKEGSNARSGTATLVAGAVTVANTSVTTSTRIYLTIQSLGTVTEPKAIAVTARVANTSFTITSADNTDTSVVAWNLIEAV